MIDWLWKNKAKVGCRLLMDQRIVEIINVSMVNDEERWLINDGVNGYQVKNIDRSLIGDGL